MKNLKPLIALVALLPVIACAQGVNHREAVQHRRIVHDIRNGSLTAREAARIRAREAAIRAREARYRRLHHGHLTAWERARLERSLHRTSHVIRHQSHDWQRRH